jgi:hypothetical protein
MKTSQSFDTQFDIFGYWQGIIKAHSIQGNSIRISQAFNPEKDNKLTHIFT